MSYLKSLGCLERWGGSEDPKCEMGMQGQEGSGSPEDQVGLVGPDGPGGSEYTECLESPEGSEGLGDSKSL